MLHDVYHPELLFSRDFCSSILNSTIWQENPARVRLEGDVARLLAQRGARGAGQPRRPQVSGCSNQQAFRVIYGQGMNFFQVLDKEYDLIIPYSLKPYIPAPAPWFV